ncbi:Polyribonucleotide nucleotidyltransferase 1, mitochondrial [Plecturocebus cupreus]
MIPSDFLNDKIIQKTTPLLQCLVCLELFLTTTFGLTSLLQYLGRPRQVNHLMPGVQDQPGQHGPTLWPPGWNSVCPLMEVDVLQSEGTRSRNVATNFSHSKPGTLAGKLARFVDGSTVVQSDDTAVMVTVFSETKSSWSLFIP